ncbi:hypothetical protein B0H19DRAFT_1072462 [Mycena capillaripes]|nr:hypothetical protein B0H19DRAFT_1072462 [Mycena capillaripes]
MFNAFKGSLALLQPAQPFSFKHLTPRGDFRTEMNLVVVVYELRETPPSGIRCLVQVHAHSAAAGGSLKLNGSGLRFLAICDSCMFHPAHSQHANVSSSPPQSTQAQPNPDGTKLKRLREYYRRLSHSSNAICDSPDLETGAGRNVAELGAMLCSFRVRVWTAGRDKECPNANAMPTSCCFLIQPVRSGVKRYPVMYRGVQINVKTSASILNTSCCAVLKVDRPQLEFSIFLIANLLFAGCFAPPLRFTLLVAQAIDELFLIG